VDKNLRLSGLVLLSSMVLAACSSGDSTTAVTPAPAPAPGPGPTATSATAAEQTAINNPMCVAVQPFYWEIGDATGQLDGASVGADAPTRSTPMAIASASKWLYAGYAVQKIGVANLDPAGDVPFLNFTSGYSQFGSGAQKGACLQTQSVQQCLDGNTSLPNNPSTAGLFNYDSEHMQVHAVSPQMQLGADFNEDLANAILVTDTGVAFDATANSFTQPLLAGGVGTSAGTYASFLMGILSGTLAMHDVVVNDAQPLGTALYKVATTGVGTSSPISDALNAAGVTEAWNYSLGHWVEDDPTYGDHATSSAGAFGFYPWIDSAMTYYGILARKAPQDPETYEGFQSAQCGRLIRQAWKTGTEVTASIPNPQATP
jgi:hypothetical protein